MASLFEDASLVMIPSGYKDGKVYSIKPTNGDGDLTFTRSNDTATRVGPDGLIEKVRTNLALYSEQFDNAFWAKTNTTVVANSGIAPNGTTTAELVYPTTTGSNRLLEKSFSISAATPYTGTWYLKASGLNWVAVDHIVGSVGAWFNLSTGTIGTIAAGCTASIENVGNGWYRCRISKTSVGTTGYQDIRLVDGDNTTSVTANGTDGLLVWGAQLETGDIATDYIATTSAAVSVGPVANLPRLDYLDSSCPKLLLEPQRTNLATDSESFSGYTGTAATIVSNQATSPDGYANADLIHPSSSGNFTGKYKTLAPSTTGVVSCFVKQAGKRYAIVGTDNNATYTCIFDLQTATVVYEATNYTGKIEAFANGWYRVSAAYSASTAASYPFIGLADDAAGAITVDGTNGLYIWGFQYETSASYETSYIPTLSAASTRGADDALKTGISSLIGQTEGVVFIDFEFNGNYDSNGIVPIIVSTGGNQLYFYINGATFLLDCDFYNNGVLQARLTTSIGSVGRKKIAFAYKQDDFVAYINGVQIGTDTSGTVGAMDSIRVGLYNSPGYSTTDGINQALLFKTRLTNAELAALTTI